MTATWWELGHAVLAVCPKAGSQSIRKAMFDTKELAAHAIKDTPFKQKRKVIWFIRHPLKRLESCYNYFTQTGWPKESQIAPTSWNSFVDAVLEGADNRHWNPQVPQVSYTRFFLPTDVYKFEQIDELWDEVIGKGTLPHLNQSIKVAEMTDYRIDELKEHFRQDLAVWNSL